MTLRFTPEYVTAGSSCGFPQRIAPVGVSAAQIPNQAAAAMASLNTREKVDALQAAMLAATDAHVHLEPAHRFADGLYARELVLPAGTTAIGHRHRQEHVCIVSQGRCLVVTDGEQREVTAPATFVVPIGTRNCVHAIEDTVWTTVHACPNDWRDVERIEAALVEPLAMLEGNA